MKNLIWEEIHKNREWGKYPNEELVRFIGKNFFSLPIAKRKNIKILELGTGQGANVWFFLKEGFDTYGIDISPSAIMKMRMRLEREGFILNDFQKRFKVGDIRKIPFEKEMFNVVVDVGTISYVSYTEHKTVFKEIWRILKPKGLFFSLHILKDSWGYDENTLIDKDTVENVKEGPLANQGNIYFANYRDLIEMLQTNGFEILEAETLIRTYQNGVKKLSWAILVAQKS
jgi:ubiquinone/menaquinone biosynthesis C-methylase UbiE